MHVYKKLMIATVPCINLNPDKNTFLDRGYANGWVLRRMERSGLIYACIVKCLKSLKYHTPVSLAYTDLRVLL